MPADLIAGGGNVPKHRVNRCQLVHLTEENIRFVLLGVLLYFYLCLGASIFQAFEQEAETEMRESYQSLFNEFLRNLTQLNEDANGFGHQDWNFKVNPRRVGISEEELLNLLHAYGNATKAGAFLRPRWDWVGSFHFAWTIVSTIGYGATTPTTTPGQLLIIPYGFFGCAGGLLFFNLFLERIITFLTGCMRCYHGFRRKGTPRTTIHSDLCPPPNGQTAGIRTPTTQMSTSTSTLLDEKPSVTWVMICLFLMSAVMISTSAALFHEVEGWTYVESLYFAFVSYATIGLGDFVTFQQVSYGSFEVLYRVVAFGVMVFGCCCIYSLLNVTSIVIKRFLNWIINRLECPCCFCCLCLNTRRQMSVNSQRNSRLQRQQYANSSSKSHHVTQDGAMSVGHHQSIDMEDSERRCSGEDLLILRRELSNKVSMAVLQKRLFETSHHQHHHSSHVNDMESEFGPRSAGPLAIVSGKFGDNSS